MGLGIFGKKKNKRSKKNDADIDTMFEDLEEIELPNC